MGDEKDLSGNASEEPDAASWDAAAAASSPPPPVTPSSPVSIPPRPVSAVPRPSGGTPPPLSRMPPPPSSRGVLPGAARSAPPPPPVRAPAGAAGASLPAPAIAPVATPAARSSVLPRQPATPPPPPLRPSSSPGAPRPLALTPGQGVAAHLEQRLGAAQLELRRLGSERHTLRARLRRESDRVQELESALRAEKELRRQASEEHQVALSGVRARLAALEQEKSAEIARLEAELAAARAASPGAAAAAPSASSKAPRGLRRIRGIGPAFQRALEQLGVTRVEQIAAWQAADVAAFAERLKIRPERIEKDDWVGQAQRLPPED